MLKNTAKCTDLTLELKAQTEQCCAKHKKKMKVSNGQWQWAGCNMVDVCIKFH